MLELRWSSVRLLSLSYLEDDLLEYEEEYLLLRLGLRLRLEPLLLRLLPLE